MRGLVLSCLGCLVTACASATPEVSADAATAVDGVPAVAASRAALEAASGRVDQAGLWPNPRVRFEARDVPRHPVALDRGGRWIEVAQPLALGGRIAAASAAAQADREAAAFDLEAARRRAATDLACALADIDAARAILAARRDAAAGADALLLSAQRGAEGGAASKSEVAAAEFDSEKARADVRRRETELAGAEAALRLLSESPLDAAGRAAGPRPVEEHPAVRAAMARVHAAEARVDEARAQRVADVEVSVSYGRVGEDDDEFVEAALTIPLPVFDRNQGRIREAQALVAGARVAAERAVRETTARAARSAAEFAAAEADVAALRDRVVPAAEAILAEAERGHTSGTVSTNDLIAARRRLADAQSALAEAVRAFRRAEAERLDLFGLATEEAPR